MKKIITASILSILCLLLFSFSVAKAQDYSQCDYSKHQHYPLNFKKVDSLYYRSGKINKCDYPNLKNIGIKTVIDLRQNLLGSAQSEKNETNNLGINYFSIPLNPFIPPTKEQINKFFTIIDNTNNLPVLVHCTHGQDRTGIMTALYRVNNNHWTFHQAYTEMLNNGYHPYRYPQQKLFLQKYVKTH